MRLSLTTWSFPACTLTEAAAIGRALGIAHVDIGLLHGPALDRAAVLADPPGSAARLAAQGVQAANLYWLFGASPHDHALSDTASLDRNLAEMDSVCRFAAALSIPTIFVLPGMARPGQSHAALMAQSATSLNALLPVAAAHGIGLTVEPHVGGILTSPKDTLALLAAVPGLKLALDYAHFTCMGFPQDQIDPLAPHAGHVHLRQARPGALQAKWGEGTLDFAAMFETLRGTGYDGFLAIEYVHQSYMNTLFDDVLTETIRMRDLAHAHAIR
jgi:sugar phosphate isomerase/epimerase